MAGLELWGGIECTINRIGSRFHDQAELSGHQRRSEDIARIERLGIRTLRYPVLWEAVAPHGLADADWALPDERLGLLKQYGINPIVGLLHHGSGPRDTSLIDEAFPEKFAEYAAAVAARFPWVSHYTPINEPLTTARFSALYGHWYPHAKDDRSFIRAVMNQCRATVMAMAAIRKVNPLAQLVQTDDLGRTFSIRKLAYQTRFDNHRRWLAWDLLCGRLDTHHPLRRYLIAAGARPSELNWFASNACPPNVIGINHYVTSNRYLHQDERWCVRALWGGNGRENYADTEAVRVLAGGGGGVDTVLKEAWQRYRIPLAITETHLGCSRDEQLRWLYDVWQAAISARTRGIDVLAVTAWALMGSYDWDSLLTDFRGHYEPGAFDVRGPGRPRLTALGRLVRRLAHRADTPGALAQEFPAIREPGWWRRSSRYLPNCAGVHLGPVGPVARRPSSHSLLITGAAGTLGQAYVRICEERGLAYVACTRTTLDIGEPGSISAAFDAIRPWGVINAAGYVRVDAAETDSGRCYRENTDGPAKLASECQRRGLPFLTFSSDLVFDGSHEAPYVESDAVKPLNVYGLSKASAEKAVLDKYPSALVVRTSAFFGPWDRYNFVTRALEAFETGNTFSATEDTVVSPTYVPDLAHASLDLMQDGECGIWHLANRGTITWAELARRAAGFAGIGAARIIMAARGEKRSTAPRPRFSALGSERGLIMPELDNALRRYVTQRASPSC